MELTLKKGVNINSLTLQHNILIRATMLLEGREGVLETEKLIRLMLATVDMVVEEDVIDLCNNDERDLMTIMMEDIEPFFNKLLEDDSYKKAWCYMCDILLKRCKEIWDNQHSAMGVIDAILTMIATMSDEDKKEALVATGKIAEQAFDRRTAQLEQIGKETNSKLEQFVRNYQEKAEKEKAKEAEEESDTE